MHRLRSKVPRLLAAAVMLGLLAAATATSPASASAGPVRGPSIIPASCECGGPGGSADLAHINPWQNPDCGSYTEVGRTGIHAFTTSTMTDKYVGWVQWVYSNNRSCRGYQWLYFHMIMGYVAGTTAENPWGVMMWISNDALDWTTFTVNYSGGQSDGQFQSVAILAGADQTTAGVWSSLVYMIGQGSQHLFVA